MFRGTPAQEGVSAATVGDKLRLRWQVELGDAITAGIVIADQVVFAATENGHLFALELTTGQKRWEFTVENDFFFAPPTVIGDRVYLGSDSGSMFAIARDTGNQIWEFKTTGAIYSSLNYVGEPGKDSLKLLFGSYDGSLYCLNSDGKELWKFTVEERVHGTPAVIDGAAAFAGCDGKLHVIDISSGQQLASAEIGSPSASAAASDGSRIYVGTYGDEVRGLEIRKGTAHPDAQVAEDPANVNANTNADHLPSGKSGLRTIPASSDGIMLKEAWTFSPDTRAGPFMSSASVRENIVIIGSRDKRIWALDATTGRPQWHFQTRGRCEVGGVIVGDRYVVGSNDGTMYALGLADGKPVWQYETGSEITAAPAVVNGCFVAGNAAGRLYCFSDDAASGSAP